MRSSSASPTPTTSRSAICVTTSANRPTTKAPRASTASAPRPAGTPPPSGTPWKAHPAPAKSATRRFRRRSQAPAAPASTAPPVAVSEPTEDATARTSPLNRSRCPASSARSPSPRRPKEKAGAGVHHAAATGHTSSRPGRPSWSGRPTSPNSGPRPAVNTAASPSIQAGPAPVDTAPPPAARERSVGARKYGTTSPLTTA